MDKKKFFKTTLKNFEKLSKQKLDKNLVILAHCKDDDSILSLANGNSDVLAKMITAFLNDQSIIRDRVLAKLLMSLSDINEGDDEE